jgi:uncharacterized protein YjiS (DUF1127 family)
MTTTTTPLSVCPGAPRREAMIVGVLRNVVAFVVRRRNRRAVARLVELDDYLLADIGLDRSELRESLGVPYAQDPSRYLVSLAESRTGVFELAVTGGRRWESRP